MLVVYIYVGKNDPEHHLEDRPSGSPHEFRRNSREIVAGGLLSDYTILRIESFGLRSHRILYSSLADSIVDT